MYEVTIYLKLGTTSPLKKLLRENNFSEYIFNSTTMEYNSGKEKREVIPISSCCGIQQVYIYNGDVLPPAIQEILERLEGEDVKHAVVGYSIKYITK